MPDYPDFVTIALRHGKTADWKVVAFRECRECLAPIFMCETGNLYADGTSVTGPVDAEPHDDGLYHSHFETCPHADKARKRAKARREGQDDVRRPSRQDRPR